MGNSTHFIGQPLLCELTKYIEKSKVLKFSVEEGGEHYIKKFDTWQHLMVMLYGVIECFDGGRIIVSGTTNGETIEVYNVGGSKIKAVSASGDNTTINGLQPGNVYIIKIGGSNVKVTL